MKVSRTCNSLLHPDVCISRIVDHIKFKPCACLFCAAERAAKVAEQQERDRSHQTSPRAGTPVGALMGVVPPPTPMGMLNPSMTPVSGNPS